MAVAPSAFLSRHASASLPTSFSKPQALQFPFCHHRSSSHRSSHIRPLAVVETRGKFVNKARGTGFPETSAAVFATTASMVESVRQAQAEIAKLLFKRAVKICKDKQVRSETLLLEGSPKEMICQAVEQTHLDLLVVGSCGLSQVKRAFLGSVSSYCAHHDSCGMPCVDCEAAQELPPQK